MSSVAILIVVVFAVLAVYLHWWLLSIAWWLAQVAAVVAILATVAAALWTGWEIWRNRDAG